jgi:hypothetical protein
MSYTPKPWTIESIEGDNIVFDSNHHSVCEVFYDGADTPNAKLIAAAPELLEALEAVIRLKPLIDYPNNTKEKHIGEAMAIGGMLSKVETAIKKAKGL